MPLRPTIFALALLATLAGCAKKKEPESPAGSLVRTIHAGSAEQAGALAESAAVSCADAADCPPSVGQLTARQDADVSTCTAFLVGEDLAVTNSHCIPSAVKLMPDLCAERIRLTLPAAGGFREESFACRKLEARSERPNDLSPDLALLRLERGTGRPFLPLYPAVAPNETFTVYKVNPVRHEPRRPTGVLVAETCPSVPNSYLFPNYRTALDPVFVAGCGSVPGNSGSPVVGAHGAVGLLQASLRLTDAQRESWLPYLEKSEPGFAPLALGTGLRCLDLKGTKIDAACAPLRADEIERPRLADFLGAAELRRETTRLLQPYLQQAGAFRWEREIIERRALEQTETLRPGCVLGTGGGDPAEATALVPTFTTRISFNRYLQPRAHARLLSEASRTFRFTRFDPARAGATRVESAGESWTIPACE